MWELLGNMKIRLNTKTVILQIATKITYIRGGGGVNYELSLLFDGFLAFLSKLRSNLFPLIQYNFNTLSPLNLYSTRIFLHLFFKGN